MNSPAALILVDLQRDFLDRPGLAPVEAILVARVRALLQGFRDLADLGIRTVVVAGIYLHGCVRSTIMDAYERGFEVLVAGDAVGSNEPDHAALTRRYLDGRAATFLDVDAILARMPR